MSIKITRITATGDRFTFRLEPSQQWPLLRTLLMYQTRSEPRWSAFDTYVVMQWSNWSRDRDGWSVTDATPEPRPRSISEWFLSLMGCETEREDVT